MASIPLKQPSAPTRAVLNYGLYSEFFARLSEEKKLKIFDLTARASRELHRWAAKYPLIRRVRVWPLSLSVTAAAPFASLNALVSMARVSLWVFTIDDLFDEETVPFSELRRRVERYKEILNGAKPQPNERDTLALALCDIREDLLQYDLFPVLSEDWSKAIIGTLDGMMLEHEWRVEYRQNGAGAKLPDYEAYLKYGMYTVGGPPHVWTVLIALDDHSILQNYEKISELGLMASTCIRLANDLRSYEKEIREAKINSVVILQRQAAQEGIRNEESLQWASKIVEMQIQESLERCIELQHLSHTQTGNPEQAIVDIARFVCDFYVNHDYHTFTAGAGRF